jgi:hypothetical protein
MCKIKLTRVGFSTFLGRILIANPEGALGHFPGKWFPGENLLSHDVQNPPSRSVDIHSDRNPPGGFLSFDCFRHLGAPDANLPGGIRVWNLVGIGFAAPFWGS